MLFYLLYTHSTLRFALNSSLFEHGEVKVAVSVLTSGSLVATIPFSHDVVDHAISFDCHDRVLYDAMRDSLETFSSPSE